MLQMRMNVSAEGMIVLQSPRVRMTLVLTRVSVELASLEMTSFVKVCDYFWYFHARTCMCVIQLYNSNVLF